MFTRFVLKLIEFYQRYVRALVPHCCRFSPSCSDYSKQALEKYGFLKGSLLALKRILKCHPFSGAQGFDPLL